MKLVPLLVVAGLAASTSPLSAQVVLSWTQTHDAPPGQSDTLNDMAVDASGRMAVTGGSFNLTSGLPPPPPTRDFETAAYDAAGTPLWSARYASTLGGDDIAFALTSTPNGRFVVVGQSGGYVSSTYVTQQSVVAYDAATGAQVWAQSYGNAGPNLARAVIALPSGELLVAGADGGPAGDGDLCVRKLGVLGNEIWAATYGGAAAQYDYAVSLALAPNGDVVAAGSTTVSTTGVTDMLVARFTSTGALSWARTFDGGAGGSDSALAVAVDASDVTYVVGQVASATNGNDAVVRAYDAAGNLLWSDVRDGTAHGADTFRRVAVDPYGRVVALGSLTQTGAGTEYALFVYTPAGALAWSRTWGGAAHLDDLARGLAIDALGNLYVAGSSTLTSTSLQEARLVSWEPNGAERFAFAYGNGTTSERFVDVEVGAGGALFVGGIHDQGVANGLDFLAARVDRTSTPFCFGDGAGTACPCGNSNTATYLSGCANSLGVGGTLVDVGSSRLSDDGLVLNGTNMPSGPCLYFQGTTQLVGGLGIPFGDGLRCIGGTILRLGVRTNVGGASTFPGVGNPSVSTVGLVTTPGTRHYQIWYRDAAPFCTAGTFDLTNAVRVDWLP